MTAEHKPARAGAATLLLVLAIFGSGALAGAAVDRALGRDPSGEKRVLPGPAKENGIPVQLKRLGITPEQEARLREVALRWQPRADSIAREFFPQVRAIERGMFQEMACVLTPAQDSAYLAWRERRGLNREEGLDQLARVREGTCPR